MVNVTNSMVSQFLLPIGYKLVGIINLIILSPRSYYEYCIVDCELDANKNNTEFYNLIEPNVHGWGNSIYYEVSYQSDVPGNRWCAWINWSQVYCGPVGLTSSDVIVQAEVHNAPHNEMNTLFSDITVGLGNGYWVADVIQGNHLFPDFPYKIIVTSPNSFRAVGRQWDILIPMVKK
jgi:hypothetical protein